MPTALFREHGGPWVDLTYLVQDASVTHQWQRPSFSTIRVPLARVSGTWRGAELKVYPNEDLDFRGRCVHVDDQGDERTMYRVATFASPSEIFEYRPVRDPDGDFSKPSIITDNVSGPQIVQAAIANSIDAGDSTPADCEGPMGIVTGTFEAGGVSLAGVPTDWPMSLSDLFARLVSTGEVDIVERPIEDEENMAEVSAYNGSYGEDLSASVSFEFATGSHNARACRRECDYRQIMNKLWTYGGPRQGTSRDPAGDQHWKWNITGSRLEGAPNVPAGTGLPDPPQSTIAAAIEESRLLHYERMMIDVVDADSDLAGVAALALELRRWQVLSWLRARGKTLVEITPQRGIAPAFRTGDKIHVAAGASFGGGFSGTQRVMEFSYRWSARSPIELASPVGKAVAGRPPVITSADAEIE
jgi:hypothetical protein